MGITGVRNLFWDWFPGQQSQFEKALNAIFDRIGFSEEYVTNSIAAHTSGRASLRSKVIKDNVWGMVEVDFGSIRLLDCPVVQRLRGIHQLGFSYLTYPSAEHSRFIHSIGMQCVIARFLDNVKRPRIDHGETFKFWSVPDVTRTDLLHAAILHDIGHMAFSHATEKIYESFASRFFCGPYTVDHFMFQCEDRLEKHLPLSECISLAVILSPRFKMFYREYVRPSDPDAVFRVAALIAGIPPDDNARGVAELVSDTAVDADKVDYINRDSVACGIPVGIDVARLFLRSAFVSIDPHTMLRLRPGQSRTDHDQVVFIVNASGVDTIEELAQARAALYHRVYLHQTTRNAERLLGKCLEALADNSQDSDPFRSVLEAWASDDFAFLEQLAAYNNDAVARIAKRLRNRDLPKRACAFGRTAVLTHASVADIFPAAKTKGVFRELTGPSLELLRRSSLNGNTLKQFEEDISHEAAALAALIRESMPHEVPAVAAPGIVAVLPMHELEGERKNCIVLENNELVDSPMRTISNPQGDAADIFKAFGYVMTDAEWRELVFLASRTVLFRRIQPLRRIQLVTDGGEEEASYNVQSVGRIILDFDAVARRAGLNIQRLQAMSDAAERVGYFDDKPLLAPLSLDSSRTYAVEDRLKLFCGQGGWRISRKTCERFIAQFPPRLRNEVLALLEGIEILDRNVLADGLSTAIKQAFPNGVSRGHIVALSPDSGHFVRTMWDQERREQLAKQGWTVRKSLEEAMRHYEAGDCFLFCDDNIISGSQANSQFLAWSNVSRDQWPADQRSEHGIFDIPLIEKELAKLQGAPFAIAVCVGTQEANERLKDHLPKLGFTQFQGVAWSRELGSSGLKLSSELEEFLREAGEQLLGWCRFGARDFHALETAEQDTCRRDALGYSGAGGLMVTPFNAPTSTFTALWCPGFVHRMPWVPLMIRRGYLKHLVLT